MITRRRFHRQATKHVGHNAQLHKRILLCIGIVLDGLIDLLLLHRLLLCADLPLKTSNAFLSLQCLTTKPSQLASAAQSLLNCLLLRSQTLPERMELALASRSTTQRQWRGDSDPRTRATPRVRAMWA